MRRIAIVAALLSGCSGAPMLPGVTPYRIDIQQGNYVTQDMVAKLKPGMTRSQVRFALGTPLVVDPFRNDRWDYIYLYSKGGQVTEQRHMTVIFKGDSLVRIEGDVVPASPASATAKPKPKPAAAAQPPVAASAGADGAKQEVDKTAPTGAGSASENPQQTEEKGFFGRMLERLGF